MKCHVKLLKGKRKGYECGRNPRKNSSLCFYHFKINKVLLEKQVEREKEVEIIEKNIVVEIIEKKKKSEKTCVICLDEIKQNELTLTCKHSFHDFCLVIGQL